ncbi:F-box/kelch-repeat protein SKIP6 [Raphanus sativus]|uniref:F-box/kelch-repeat protein At5g03000 n=1 Tax=Raphanus sativus TaxID=3726 RepID=A0A9W3CRS8_RAPSA|nr:putative F-box/kelch-repeat protein At5g03000 [Raphanus sativus]KAJ4870459.1 F-box/kelch-repeat protein SKIP6 [Raphanus sativus]
MHHYLAFSKRYRSLVASPELYEIRSQLGYSCFYICLSIHGPASTPRWFIISLEKNVNRLMTPIPPSPSSHPMKEFSVVSLDCGIYVIGGSIKRKREYFSSSDYRSSSSVFLLDCRTHTWRQVPSMKVARCEAAAGVVDGKIYVLGGCDYYKTYGEVFDPKTQTWTTLPQVPYSITPSMSFRKTIVMGEKVYAVPFLNSRDLLYYSPNEGIWGIRKKKVDGAWKIGIKSYCFS